MISSKVSDFIALSKEILGKGSMLRFRARGFSMQPFIRDSEVIHVKPAGFSDIKLGDVVFYCVAGKKLVAHRAIKRISEKGKILLVTVGDSFTAYCDYVHPDDILGKVVIVEKNGEKVVVDKYSLKIFALLRIRVTFFLKQKIFPIIKNLRTAWYILSNKPGCH